LPPLFILEEEEQWYPPGFLILCSVIPHDWLKKRFWLVNHLIDLMHVSIAYALLAANGLALYGGIAMVIYAILAPLSLEFASLNTRPLGLFMLSAFLVSAQSGMQSPIWALLAGIIGVLLFYSHKLSLQQLWFTLPLLALVTGDWRWAVWLPGIYLLSWLIWPNGFRNIISGHRAIIAFWNRNWPRLGAHAVRQSPVYGDGQTRTDYYSIDGLLGVARLARDALYQNFFVLAVVVLTFVRPWPGQYELFLLTWILSVYVWASMIHILPSFRRIGLGRQYIKFAILPTILYLVPAVIDVNTLWCWALIGLCTLLTSYRYLLAVKILHDQTLGQTGVVSPGLRALLERLKQESSPRVMCLPVHLCDLVAYESRIPTFWGTHSHCFDERLERFFPVLKFPLEYYIKDGNLTHLLLDTRYVLPQELGLSDEDCIVAVGDFALYRLAEENEYRAVAGQSLETADLKQGYS